MLCELVLWFPWSQRCFFHPVPETKSPPWGVKQICQSRMCHLEWPAASVYINRNSDSDCESIYIRYIYIYVYIYMSHMSIILLNHRRNRKELNTTMFPCQRIIFSCIFVMFGCHLVLFGSCLCWCFLVLFPATEKILCIEMLNDGVGMCWI